MGGAFSPLSLKIGAASCSVGALVLSPAQFLGWSLQGGSKHPFFIGNHFMNLQTHSWEARPRVRASVQPRSLRVSGAALGAPGYSLRTCVIEVLLRAVLEA